MLRILIALDGSGLSEKALLHGAALARCFESEIVLLQVIEYGGNGSTVDTVDWQLRRQQASAYLEGQTEKLKALGLNAEWTVEEGKVADRIVGFAHQNTIDLIVVGSHGHGGVSSFTRGGIAQKVISAASTSIMVSPPVNSDQQVDTLVYKSVLVPVDGSKSCQWTVNLAAAIAAVHGAEIILMQAIERPQLLTSFSDPREKRDLLAEYVRISRMEATCSMQELKAALPANLKVTTDIVVTDNTANAINEMAVTRNVGLVALSAHSDPGSAEWHYGMIPEFLLAHSNRPVMVFQHDHRNTKCNFRSIYLPEHQANASEKQANASEKQANAS